MEDVSRGSDDMGSEMESNGSSLGQNGGDSGLAYMNNSLLNNCTENSNLHLLSPNTSNNMTNAMVTSARFINDQLHHSGLTVNGGSSGPLSTLVGSPGNNGHSHNPTQGMGGASSTGSDGGTSRLGDLGVVRTRRRKAGISEQDRLCVVCGEAASGYNFDRLTCESCKAFFRRNAFKIKEKIKACSRGEKCDVSGSQRKHCPSCRLEKCFKAGMKKELILPPEKLEQRAKPRRRKHTSMSGDNDGSLMPDLSHSRSGMRGMGHHSGFPPSPSGDSMGLHGQFRQNISNNLKGGVFPHRVPSSELDSIFLSGSGPQSHPHPLRLSNPLYPQAAPYHRSLHDPTPASQHPTPHFSPPGKQQTPGGDLSSSDRDLYERLSECLLRLREPFSPDDQLQSGAAETLEQAYNRMDTCIRRIIRVAKMIPYFVEIGKDAQIYILKANIYGLIILYSSFFFEKDSSKLCYPVKSADGEITRIKVSMLEDISDTVPIASLPGVLPMGTSSPSISHKHSSDKVSSASSSSPPLSAGGLGSSVNGGSNHSDRSSVIREDFELYKRNTLAAFTELQDLANGDDYIRVCMLALKLFSTECLPNQLRGVVDRAQSAYLVFLHRYLICSVGEAQTAKLYPRLLMAFIDIRTLEIRMTEFAKLLRLDGLSPLMREVCSHR